MRYLFATTNKAKIRRYGTKLIEKGIELLTLDDLNIDVDIDENGNNPIENAIIKATTYNKISDMVTIAMDDGLFLYNVPDEVQPGTHVRRVNGKRLDDKEEPKTIPGGTPGYLTPEFFYESVYYMEDEELRTQDYFAIGATIFFLKYGKNMLNYRTFLKEIKDDNKIELNKAKEEKRKKKLEKEKAKYKSIENELTGDILVYLLDNAIDYIKKQKYQDKNFDEFLCGLIQFKPKYRNNFEKIIRNKWLNKNLEEIKKIEKIYTIDESNLLLELQKSDFIINNVKRYRKEFDKLNETYDKQYINNKKGKFKFRKKIKNKI